MIEEREKIEILFHALQSENTVTSSKIFHLEEVLKRKDQTIEKNKEDYANKLECKFSKRQRAEEAVTHIFSQLFPVLNKQISMEGKCAFLMDYGTKNIKGSKK